MTISSLGGTGSISTVLTGWDWHQGEKEKIMSSEGEKQVSQRRWFGLVWFGLVSCGVNTTSSLVRVLTKWECRPGREGGQSIRVYRVEI